MRESIQETIGVLEKFKLYLLQLSPYLAVEKYDFLTSDMDNIKAPDAPLVTCVIDSNGQDNHCITIYRKWIYDSNFSHALPLQKKLLDLCCSSNLKMLSFSGTKNCYIFPLFHLYLKSNQEKDKKLHENEKRNKKRLKRQQKQNQQKMKKVKLE